ncbi:MAG: hypothetical protein ACFFED_06990 [Candidatus Thorarchaeota archaeon]
MTLEVGDTIKGIELTPEGKKPVKSIDFVSGESRINALHDPVRIQILQMLREGIDDFVTTETADNKKMVLTITKSVIKRHALSVTELIQLSNREEGYESLTKNQLYHHLPILMENGFVIEYGTVTTGKRTTKYYRRLAESFVTFGLHYGPKRFKDALRKEISGALPVFNVDKSPSELEELVELLVDTEALRLKWANVIENLVQGDVTDPKAIELFEWFLWVYATGQDEYKEMLDRLRASLFGA